MSNVTPQDRQLAQAVLERLCRGGTVGGIRFGGTPQLLIYNNAPPPLHGEVYVNLDSRWALFPSRPAGLPAEEADLPEFSVGEQLQTLCSLRDRRIMQVELGASAPHLILTFDNGAVFFMCGNTPDYEAWEVGVVAYGSRTERWLVVVTPGGGLVTSAPETFIRGVRSTAAVPAKVAEASAVAAQLGFYQSSIPEVGRLLQTLAATVRAGAIGEIGTGCGVGAAWTVSGMQPGVSFYTVESTAERARAARGLLQSFPNVRVIQGDWKSILPFGPFALLFVDARDAKESEAEAIVAALEVGGMVLLDDLTPEEYWPGDRGGKPDPVRSFWLNHARLRATELRVTRESAVILAVRLQ